jgi:hypothetical protein
VLGGGLAQLVIGAQLGEDGPDLPLAKAQLAQGGEDLGVCVGHPRRDGLAVGAAVGVPEYWRAVGAELDDELAVMIRTMVGAAYGDGVFQGGSGRSGLAADYFVV